MSRFSRSLLGLLVALAGVAVPAQEAIAAREPARDLVRVSSPGTGIFRDISVVAESDPLGGSPSGTVSFRVVVGELERTVSGPVTCLAVHGNRALVGFLDTTTGGLGPITVVVLDNGATQDGFAAEPVPTDCMTDPGFDLLTLEFGDVLVHDSPSKAQCANGGWRTYMDEAGRPFRNQGKCIAFVLGAAK